MIVMILLMIRFGLTIFKSFYKLIDSEKNGIEYIQFVTALKEDERFIVLDNNLVLIK